MWTYHNPVAITFGSGCFDDLATNVVGRPYLLVTYADAPFTALTDRLAQRLGPPAGAVRDVAPNPDRGNRRPAWPQLHRPDHHPAPRVATRGMTRSGTAKQLTRRPK
ncbi:MAG: hypothetical protein JJU19_04065 [Pararhodobacter sp.]|nr:hypothetical protein [Pararhodobacter sp.]